MKMLAALLIVATVDTSTVRMRIHEAVDAQEFTVGSCKWRDAEIRAYWLSGGPIPTILLLSDNVHRVYLESAEVEPDAEWVWFTRYDYPTYWCQIEEGVGDM